MSSEEFKKQIKKELSGRPVGSVEILQFENWAKINKLQNEVVLKAVIFAKTIKGPAINKNYIMAILNNWLDLDIKTPNDVNSFLLSKSYYLISVRENVNGRSRADCKRPFKREYGQEQLNSLFDNLETVEKPIKHGIFNKEYNKTEINKLIKYVNNVEL